MRDVGIVYLCRFAEGEKPVLRFLQSYRAYQAGVEHDLNIVFKGFPNSESLAQGRALFEGLPITSIEVDDTGYDLGSYLKAAREARNGRLIFLNTFSQLLAHDWLAHFNRAMDDPKVGLVGATGSWAANTAGYEATFRFIILKTLGKPAQHYQSFDFESSENTSLRSTNSAARFLKMLLLAPVDYIVRFQRFGRFPNPHIRTNAFMVNREQFLSLDFPSFKSKLDAYKFESGRRSMTKRILARNLKAVIVDRNGKTYEVSDWKDSSTFRINGQVNLIVADNRTADYEQASSNRRQYLERLTWVHPWDWDIATPPSTTA